MRDGDIRGKVAGVTVVGVAGVTATAATTDAGISTAAGTTSSTLLSGGLATVAVAAGGAVAESWGRVLVERIAMMGHGRWQTYRPRCRSS